MLYITMSVTAPNCRICILDSCQEKQGDSGKHKLLADMNAHIQEAVDAWSLGVMAFELLTGRSAFRMVEGKEKVLSLIYLGCLINLVQCDALVC